MLRMIVLLAAMAALTACAGARQLVNCENAAKLKEGAVATIAAVDFACPVQLPPEAPAATPPASAPAAPPVKEQAVQR